MKGPEAFRTISEAANELGVPQHVLRFWETRFSFIRPMKRAGGRRFYRPQDITMLSGVRALLHDEGYTIKGVQRLHKEQGIKRLMQAAPAVGAAAVRADDAPLAVAGPAPAPSAGALREFSAAELGRLREALDDLLAAKARLGRLIQQP